MYKYAKKSDIHIFYFSEYVDKLDFDRYTNDLDKLYGTQIKIIFDLENIEDFDKNLIFEQIKYMNFNEDNAKKFILKSAIIISNSFFKTLLNFLFNIRPPISPNFVGERHECLKFIIN